MTLTRKATVDTSESLVTKATRRDRVRQRRRHLSEVVMQLIQERGFSAVSVNEVAARASMSVGGLYRHIKTKNELLEMICDEINLDLLEEMKRAAAAQKGIAPKLEAAIRAYWERHWTFAAGILVAYREYQSFSKDAQIRYTTQEQQLAGFFGDLIRAGVANDDFRPVDEQLLSHEIILLSHMRALKGWVFGTRDKSAVLAEHLELIFARLSPRHSLDRG